MYPSPVNISDPRAVMVMVSPDASDARAHHDVITSNVDVVNALFDAMLRAEESAAEALHSYYVDYLCAQVLNGGFSQFVYNSRWDTQIVGHVRAGLIAMNATRERDMFQAGVDFIARAGPGWLQAYCEREYFGDNPARDQLDKVVPGRIAHTLRDYNAAWLRSLPNLVTADRAQIVAEVERRSNALPDRAERIARARAAESRDLRLIRALCERGGQVLDRRTGASLRTLDGAKVWCFFFITDRGPHFMIDLGTRAVMFPTDRAEAIDMRCAITEITCTPE
jgi:hypothetical protein